MWLISMNKVFSGHGSGINHFMSRCTRLVTKAKYFHFLWRFLPQDGLLKKLWMCNNKDVNQNWENNVQSCQNVVVGELWLDFPGVSNSTGLGLVSFVLSKMKNARISGNAEMPEGDGERRERPKQVFCLLPKSHVAKSGVGHIWVKIQHFWLCSQPSLNHCYLTDIFLPRFLHHFVLCAVCCFGEEF